MLETIALGGILLFNPFGFASPQYHIETQHFGNKVPLAQVDAAFKEAASPYAADPLRNWVPLLVPRFTRVVVAPFIFDDGIHCKREVQYSVVETGSGGYTVIISPRTLPGEFQETLQRAFEKELHIVSGTESIMAKLYPCME